MVLFVLLDFVFKALSYLLMRHNSHTTWTQCLHWPPLINDCSHCRTRSNFIFASFCQALPCVSLTNSFCLRPLPNMFLNSHLCQHLKAQTSHLHEHSQSTLSFSNTYDFSTRIIAIQSLILRHHYTLQLIWRLNCMFGVHNVEFMLGEAMATGKRALKSRPHEMAIGC